MAAPASLRVPGLVRLLALALAFALQALLAAGAGAQPLQPVPPLQARVTDLTGTLDAGQRQQLEAQLAAIEQRKGAQVVVLMVPTTRPEEIEQFGIRVAEAWKIGRGRVGGQQVDDGVILLVAKDDRKVRIEVGYGLEGAIPDAYARRIIAEAITPRFREGDFFGGLQAAVAGLGRLIDGEPLPAPGAGQGGGQADEVDWLAGLLVVFVGGMIATAVLGRLLGSAAGGAGAGALAAAKGLPLLVAGGVGVVAFIAFLVFSASGGGGGGGGGGLRPGRRAGPRGGPVIWTGRGGSGWGGGGGLGGGGFRGGGGGFGGGGSSGSW